MTNDSQIVQEAINNASQDGGVLDLRQWGKSQLQVGNLEVHKPIDATTRLMIRGNGVTLNAIPGADSVMTIRRSNVTVEGIQFYGVADKPTDGLRILASETNVRTLVLRECSFERFGWRQVWVGNGEGISIHNCHFRGENVPNTTGVWIENEAGRCAPRVVTVRDCQFFGGHRCGILVSSKDKVTHNVCISDCYIDRCQMHSVYVQDTRQVVLRSLYLEGRGNAQDGQQELVHLRGPKYVPYVVENCTFDKYARWVLSLFGCTARVRDNFFTGSYDGGKEYQFEGHSHQWRDNTVLP